MYNETPLNLYCIHLIICANPLFFALRYYFVEIRTQLIYILLIWDYACQSYDFAADFTNT